MRKPCSPSCASVARGASDGGGVARASGYSLVELLVAVTVGLAVIAGVLTLALSSRRLYESEQARTRLSQNLRAGKDFLVVDIRQAGERLDANFPAIEVIRGEDLPGGAAGDPDELVLRRNLLDTVLRVCDDVDPTGDDVAIGDKIAPAAGCAPLPVEPGDTYPINLQRWSDRRVAAGGLVRAYIYNPVTRLGEFFEYDSESEDASGFYVSKPGGSPSWMFSYPTAEQCRVYILEERRYRVAGGLLQMVVDEQSPVNLVDGIDDFQLLALLKPTPIDPTPAPLESFDGIDWPDLRTIQVAVAGRIDLRDRAITRDWSAEIMPRNALGG